MFGWCSAGQHDKCIREYQKFYLDPKGKVVYTGEIRTCRCAKRGCKCYAGEAERPKKKRKS